MERRPPSPDHPRSVSILGATGSIGSCTLDLIERNPECYRVEAVTAFSQVDDLAAIARRTGARLAVIGRPELGPRLRSLLEGTGIACAEGPSGLVEAATLPADWVMAAIVGAAGLEPTMAAIRRGAMVALANKECLVCAGDLMMAAARRHEATLLPVDSEHNAIFQALGATPISAVEKLILTASGGPFRTASQAAMERATPAEAIAHPNWSMGAKISVDSATMMNKGLELIEAHHLFAMPAEAIEVLVHPQSIVHSLVAFTDGSLLAQLGAPDMRIPIASTLGWPARLDCVTEKLDLAQIARLDFSLPDETRFPALALARHALQQGGGAPTILNAANEVAVAAFIAGRLGFMQIAGLVESVLESMGDCAIGSFEDVLAIDGAARRMAETRITQGSVRLSGAGGPLKRTEV